MNYNGRGVYYLTREVIILTRERLANAIMEREDEAYYEALEIGISNTIAALHDTNVKDEEIIRVMNKYWGIAALEVEKRLLREKGDSVVNALRYHLKMQGYNDGDIQHFMIHNKVGKKIRNNPELCKLKNSPEKLKKLVIEEE